MKIKKKNIIRFLDYTNDVIVIVVFIIMFLVGLYGLYDSYLVYRHANDTSLLKYKPGYSHEETDKPIKGNMVAWVVLTGTKVDYPIMQGETNEDYLNVDPFGDYSLSGSVFLDYRNKADFSDEYSLVYGHHMEQGYMFGALDRYATSETYFRNHLEGSLILNDAKATEYKIRVFAVADCDSTNDSIFGASETNISTVLSYISMHSIYIDKDAISQYGSSRRIVALSTCKYPNTSERTILFCYMISEGKESVTERVID